MVSLVAPDVSRARSWASFVPTIAVVPNEFPPCLKNDASRPRDDVAEVPTTPFVAKSTPSKPAIDKASTFADPAYRLVEVAFVVVPLVATMLVAKRSPTVAMVEVSVSTVPVTNRPIVANMFVEVADPMTASVASRVVASTLVAATLVAKRFVEVPDTMVTEPRVV